MKYKNHELFFNQEKTIVFYLDKMWKILPFIFFACSILELTLYIFVSGNSTIANDANYIRKSWSLFETFLPTALSFIFYIPCYLFYKNKKTSFHMKKTYFQIILYLSATFFIYGHSGYPVLLAMYIIPLFTSCAFSKSAVRRSVWYSTFFIILYAAIKTYCTSSTYFITLSLVVELLVLLSSLIAFNVNNQYHEAVKGLIDAMKYSDELIYKVHTDSVTGAFSREKLEVDLNNFLFKSIAFLDLDDFKKVNDIYGHNMGDWVLNTFVTCLSESKIRMYRYGGDEFLIASILSPVELKELLNYKIENFKYQTNLQLGEPVTVSCGIILSDKFSRDDIKKADEVMYSVKKASKNNIKVIE